MAHFSTSVWLIQTYFCVAFLLAGVLIAGVPCAAWAACSGNQGMRRKLCKGSVYFGRCDRFLGSVLLVLISWAVTLFLWFLYSPMSVCASGPTYGVPPMRNASRMEGTWDGGFWCTHRCEQASLFVPARLEDAQSAISSASSVRAVGGGHSTSALQCAQIGGLVLSLEALCNESALRLDALGDDPPVHIVRAPAGCSVFLVQQWLAARHFHLKGYGGSMSQSMAGALSTSLHGVYLQSFADYLMGLTAILADGSIREVLRGDDHFDAWPGSMGELGVIVEIKMRVWPVSYMLCERVIGDRRHLVSAVTNDSAWFYADGLAPGRSDYVEQYSIKTCTSMTPSEALKWSPELELPSHELTRKQLPSFKSILLEYFGYAVLFLWSGLPAVRIDLMQQFLVPSAHSPRLVSSAGSNGHSTSYYSPFPDCEVAVPMAHCDDFLVQARKWIDERNIAFHIQIRRLLKATGLRSWTAAAAEGDARFCTVGFVYYDYAHWKNVPRVVKFMQDVQRQAEQFGGGSHRGKVYARDPATLMANVPPDSMRAFESYRHQLDPNNKFQSSWTQAMNGVVLWDSQPSISPELDERSRAWRSSVIAAFVVSVLCVAVDCVARLRRRHRSALVYDRVDRHSVPSLHQLRSTM